jgi:hypothetical protein
MPHNPRQQVAQREGAGGEEPAGMDDQIFPDATSTEGREYEGDAHKDAREAGSAERSGYRGHASRRGVRDGK